MSNLKEFQNQIHIGAAETILKTIKDMLAGTTEITPPMIKAINEYLKMNDINGLPADDNALGKLDNFLDNADQSIEDSRKSFN